MKRRFKQHVDLYHRAVYNTAYRILGNPTEAEDATQEVYERLWKHLAKMDDAIVKPWLLRVTKNLCIDRIRARKPVDELRETEHLDCEKNQPVALLAHTQLSAWLQSAIGRLGEPYRSLIRMLDLEQMSTKDAAKQLGLSENQTKVYRHRARKQLKAFLQGVEL